MKFKIPANSSIRPSFPARYIFIDDISVMGGSFRIIAKSEKFFIDQKMKEGSKLVGLPEIVNEWMFENDSGVELEIEISAGLVFYDRNELKGDVNALTRADNITKNGTEFFCGWDLLAVPSKYSMLAMLNPTDSGVNAYVNVLRLNAYGVSVVTSRATEAEIIAGGLNLTYASYNKDFDKLAIGSCELHTNILSLVSTLGQQLTTMSSDTYGTPSSLDFKESPIKIPPGMALVFSPSVQNTKLSMFAELSEEVII